LQHDVILLSGGVSAGVLDLVPEVLAELGVERVFHKVAIKPGKPIWFGVWKNEASKGRTLVFGLPGNPLSSFVGFELFVKPAIARLAGRPWYPPHPTQPAKLSTAFQTRGDRATYHPAITTHSADGLIVEPTVWKGSADLRGFVGANALIAFPPGKQSFAAGETVECLPL
jgi:molybdopterin molybdotransferase